MTPAARVQASIEILDEILTGAPVEKALTGWARRSRFAGSKDRAAVRDHVFDALRCRRSYAALGGSNSGRGLMIGAIRASDADPADLFTGDGHAPLPVQDAEAARGFETEAERFDIPEWLWPRFTQSLGGEAVPCAQALQGRAAVHLRVNLLKSDVAKASEALKGEGIIARPTSVCHTALEVTEGARRIAQSRAYAEGLVELQDAASQAVVSALELKPGMRVLDYCAGGGGKALALAANKSINVFAHDVNQGRMKDIPIRAERAGARITVLNSSDLAGLTPFDVVLADAPCSGSGSWRRAPAGKWALTEERLTELTRIQSGILKDIAPLVRAGGVLAYASCSVLDDENSAVVTRFLAQHSGWNETFRKSWPVTGQSDGFFTSHLTS
ncbi:RsmB/NOP family class I SAM-dependent RNA methyltransferase [Ruegeria sp. 6PALISEP08]|uniref:RsmB/NOP family class I SAM-dependent RNA methyltransferase n=1 Tax=Ruegeria sp. 6PALISEP08 TaxID=1225660 RepID=UPI00067E83DF|nr:RsmB/NOP family class I SAM-dependent RNA methyltransferase [Ruegeria sp. 6PALISEP08]